MNTKNFSCARAICRLLFLTIVATYILVQKVAPAQSLTLIQILTKHKQAAGTPEALGDKSGQKVIYSVDMSMVSGTLTEYNQFPDLSKVQISMGPITGVTGFDGEVGWEEEGDGSVRILQGDELKEVRAESGFTLEDFDPLTDSSKAKVTLRSKRDPESGDYLVDVVPSGGSLQTISINPKTFLLDHVQEHHAGLVADIDIKGYKDVNGLEIPSVADITYQGVPITITTTLQSAERGLIFTPGFFSAPQSTSDFQILGPNGTSSESIPFQLVNGEIVMQASVNGQSLNLLLDTGAGKSFLTEDAATKAELTVAGQVVTLGYGGSAPTAVSDPVTVEIPGALKISNQKIYVVLDPSTNEALHRKAGADGAIGYDIISHAVVTINYPQKTITFSDPSSYVPAKLPGSVTIPIRLDSRIPLVTGAIDGKSPGEFVFDTGDNGGLLVYNKYALANHLPSDPTIPGARVSQALGVGGAVDVITTPDHSFTVGSLTLQPVTLSVFNGAGLSAISESAGGFGNALVRNYVVTLDYSNVTMTITPSEPPSSTNVPANQSYVPSTTVGSNFRLTDQTIASSVPTPGLTVPQGQPGAVIPDPTLVPAPLPAHPSLDDILSRHLIALGGQNALTAIQNTRVTATLDTGGTDGTVVTIYESPCKEYEQDKLGALNITQGYDGQNAWKQDSNGDVRLLSGDEIKDLRNQLFFDTNSYVLPDRLKGKMSLLPGTEVGTGDYIVQAIPDGGKPMKLYFDPSTYLIAKDEQAEDDQTVTTTYSGYQRIDDVMFPFVMHITNGDPHYDATVTATKIENNVNVSNTLFSMPLPPPTASIIPLGAHESTIHYHPEYGEIGVDCAIDGHPITLFLDSGSAGIAISQDVVNTLKLKEQGYLEAHGYGGSTDFRPVHIDRFEVQNGVSITNVTAVAVDLPESFQDMADKPVSGFVGYDLLSRFVVQMDYVRHTIRLISPERFNPGKAFGIPLPIQLDDDVPKITASVDSLPSAQFLVDTGDVSGLRLYGPYVHKNNLRNIYTHGIPGVGGGIGGLSYSWRTRVHKLTVGRYTLYGVPADFSLDSKGGGSVLEAGALGAEVLSHFIVTFDYPHNTIYLLPNPLAPSDFSTKTTGVDVMKYYDGWNHLHIVVAGVDPSSPAAHDNLAPNDEILQINGESATKLGLEKVRNILAGSEKGTAVTIEVRKEIGRSRILRLSYFDPLKS